MIDLHSHTTASDGQHKPFEQMAMAAKAGVTVLAVTDHDTVSGLAESHEAANAHGIRLVPGIEVSVHYNRREVHILGHFVDPTVTQLASFDLELKRFREQRMGLMVDRLRALGFPVTLEAVRAIAGNAHLARPHLARWLVEAGVCTSTKEAFSRFLSDRGPIEVPRFEYRPEQAIELIHSAHGTATLAHPGPTRINHHELSELKAMGLDGLEVHHSDHPPTQRTLFLDWAQRFDLIATAGSDFHGDQVAPDRRFGTVSMEPAALSRLESLRR